MAVVKADAYGHGLEGVARALDGEVGAFAVACPDEAAVVSRVTRTASGPGRPVYLLSPSLPEEVAGIVAAGWIPAVSSAEEVRAFAAEAAGQGRKQRVHVVVDTGMGRIGALPAEAGELIGLVRGMRSLEREGFRHVVCVRRRAR
jgi:alanine racemase